MPPEASLAIAAASLILYLYCFTKCYRRPDGRGRQYLLVVFGVMIVYFAMRTIGYCGLSCHWMGAMAVNELFRWSGYVVIIPGVVIATWGWGPVHGWDGTERRGK